MEEDGYEEFPACCPRWDVTGQDVYGRGPGMDALPDVNMLQRMRQDGLEALELEIKPPMNVSNSLRNQGGQFSLRPGFVYERNAEKLLMLGPTLERLRSELFQPLIQRVLGIMKRYGKILPVPPLLRGREWEIEMQSSLALAQKSADIAAIENIMLFAGNLAKINPDVLDNLDLDEMLLHNAKLLGVPLSLLRGKDSVFAIREQRRREQAMQQEEQKTWQLLEKGASTAKMLSEVDLEGKNFASALLGAMRENTPENPQPEQTERNTP